MSQTHEKYHLGKQNTTFVTLVYYNSHSQSNSKRKRLPKKQDTNSYLIFSTAIGPTVPVHKSEGPLKYRCYLEREDCLLGMIAPTNTGSQVTLKWPSLSK